MIKKIEGIIINETPYGDNSKIVNVLSNEIGMFGIMCKGVKSIRNPLRTKTQKFTYAYFHVEYKENKLSKLIDVDIIDNFKNIRSDITLISYVSYITELTYQVVKQNDDPEIYKLYKESLIKINNLLDPQIITNILELKYLEYLGVGLNLDACIKCGSKKSIVTVDPDEGGYICKNCYNNEMLFSPRAIQMLRKYLLIEINSISSINIKKEVVEEIDKFLSKYYERYTGLYLKSKDFLKKIKNS